jgi:2,3-dihydroxy-p-cumate/2,3-dihydroxybenzoate 3,4-dioxygenase
VFEYSSGVREIADDLLYRERQFPFELKGFCEWGAKPQIKEFRNLTVSHPDGDGL